VKGDRVPTVAYSDSFADTLAYHLASACDQIYLQPHGFVSFTGTPHCCACMNKLPGGLMLSSPDYFRQSHDLVHAHVGPTPFVHMLSCCVQPVMLPNLERTSAITGTHAPIAPPFGVSKPEQCTFRAHVLHVVLTRKALVRHQTRLDDYRAC